MKNLLKVPFTESPHIFLFSAGGIGALVHADRLRSRLPPSVKTLHALVDASIFVDVPDVDGLHTMAKIFKAFYYLHSLKGGYDYLHLGVQ